MGPHLGEDDRNASFEAQAMPHLDAAYQLARWLTRDDHDAEDLVQSAYLRAFKAWDGFRGGDVRAWLLTIVRNTFYSTLRDEKHERAHVGFDEALHSQDNDEAQSSYASHHDPAHLAAIRATGADVNRALESLAPAFREVLVLKELDDLSYKQIGEIAGIPIGTVMSRLARARKQLLAYFMHEQKGM